MKNLFRMLAMGSFFGGSSGGSAVQHDWNQNDPSAPDYIKNKPFYSEMLETVVEAQDTDLVGFPVFKVGDTVVVKVDGVEHKLVAFDDEGCAAIGNTFADLDEGVGQFGWQIYCDQNTVIFYSQDTHTVSYKAEVVHKMEYKYLPKMAIVIDLSEKHICADHNTNDDFEEFSRESFAVEEITDVIDILKNMGQKVVFYNFDQNHAWRISLENYNGFEGIYMSADFWRGSQSVSKSYNYYIDDSGIVWGKFYLYES